VYYVKMKPITLSDPLATADDALLAIEGGPPVRRWTTGRRVILGYLSLELAQRAARTLMARNLLE
jgi:hypothetical protein